MKVFGTQLQRSMRLSVLMVAVLSFTLLGSGCSTGNDKVKISQTSLYDFSSTISQTQMMETIKKLASKDNARISGFDGEREAANYISEQFKALALETDEQPFPVDAYMVNTAALELSDSEMGLIQGANAMNFSAATPNGGLKAEVISVSQGTDTDYKGKAIKGNVVLIQRGSGETFAAKITRAESYGAVGAIFYDPLSDHLSGTFGSLSNIPGMSIPTETALKIESKLAEGAHIEAALLVDSVCKASTSQNIIGLYKSSNNPEGKQIIVSAHYDGVDTPAANDNGSGTSVLMEMARILASEKIELPYDIKFIAFGSEETGLLGSSAYVYQMDSEEVKRTLAVVNIDMIGVGDTINLCIANGQSTTPLLMQTRQFCERLAYDHVVQEIENSDHTPFAYAGIPALTLYTTEDTNYHTDEDTIDKIQPDMLAKICNLGLTICTELNAQ